MSVLIEEVYINITDTQISVSLYVFHIIPFLFWGCALQGTVQ